jgi:hypothetical protein
MVPFTKWHFNHVLLCIFDALLNGGSDFTALAQSVSHTSFFIPNYHNGAEAERTSTFGGFGDTVDSNQAFLQIGITCA